MTLTDVSSGPHTSELEAETKKPKYQKKNQPQVLISLPANPGPETLWQLSASTPTSLQACLKVLAE